MASGSKEHIPPIDWHIAQTGLIEIWVARRSLWSTIYQRTFGEACTWWLLSIGGEAEAQDDTPLDINEPSVPGAVRRRGKRWRVVGIFQHGWSLIIAALLNNRLLPVKLGRPEAWPRLPDSNEAPMTACLAGGGE